MEPCIGFKLVTALAGGVTDFSGVGTSDVPSSSFMESAPFITNVHLYLLCLLACLLPGPQRDESAFAYELLTEGGVSGEEAGDIMTQALGTLEALERELDAWEMRRLLCGPFDDRPAQLCIQAGVGGAWAESTAGHGCEPCV